MKIRKTRERWIRQGRVEMMREGKEKEMLTKKEKSGACHSLSPAAWVKTLTDSSDSSTVEEVLLTGMIDLSV